MFHAEQTSRNVFKSFVEDINHCSTHMVSLSTMVLGSVRHKHDACLAYRAECHNLLSVLQEWGVSPFNLKRSFFDIAYSHGIVTGG